MLETISSYANAQVQGTPVNAIENSEQEAKQELESHKRMPSATTTKEVIPSCHLLAKMDALPPIQQSELHMEIVIQQLTTQRATLEANTSEFKEQLQARRTHIATCDKKLAELEAFKADIEKKIKAC